MPPRIHVAGNREFVYKPVGRVAGRGSFKMVPATPRQASSSAAPVPAMSAAPPPPVVDPPPRLDNDGEGPGFEIVCEEFTATRKKSGKVSQA